MQTTTHFPHDWTFPPITHQANGFFDRAALLARLELQDWREWVTLGLRHAKWDAERFFASNPTARAYVTLVWYGDGSVRLVRIGPRGGHKVLWTFRQAD